MINRKKKFCKGCSTEQYLFGRGFCQSCYKVNTIKKIKPVSAKREVENKEYTIKRLKFLSQPENHRCPITMEVATEIHHIYSGANRSKYYLDEKTWVAVSRNGHLWIHANPSEAREKGYFKTY